MIEVNALAVRAKTDKAAMLSLWKAVERLICHWASKYRTDQGTRIYDHDDLVQAGFLALVDAVKGYAPDNGRFTTYLRYHVRRRFREVSGHRSTKIRPECDAVSLDMPVSDEADASRLERLADPSAHLEYDAMVDKVGNAQICAGLLAEIEQLPPDQRDAIMLTVWHGESAANAAALMEESTGRVRQLRDMGLRKVRGTKSARMIRNDLYPRRVSLAEFQCTFTSEVEAYLLWLERLQGV